MAKKEKTPPPPADESKGGETAEAAAPAKKGGKLKLIIIVVAAMAVGGGGAFAALKLLGGGSAPAQEELAAQADPAPEPGSDTESAIKAPTNSVKKAEGTPAEGEGGEIVEPQGPVNIEFKPFVVNLGDSGGKRFLKLTMSVEAETPELEQEINTKMPQFRDIILLLLSSLAYDDISTLDGKMRLRSQMLNRINTQLSAGKIKNIYFSEFVVQ